ncbi:HET-domain-containing protein [Tothia fuscella]|uniref:HET-domain-containing protein n=1 Tax=Tothia fuscella TaxID=1048955 RepID=A0A9P4TUM8_9PEZI|nr:HET-domain-containing protein [Tothia fuscella]
MWLLNTTTLVLHEFINANAPPYAILSHTWGPDEALFHEFQNLNNIITQKIGFKKIAEFCELAESLGFDYAWVDTACIDKRSSAELTEALNSMYKWYCDAGLCITYLVDVHKAAGTGDESRGAATSESQADTFRESRWFNRVWTLQELIACKIRRFYASDWSEITAHSLGENIITLCSQITSIPAEALWDLRPLSSYCIAERMSWAAHRHSTRPEDITYSLMGIFRVNMPILYGEGHQSAFRRLQEEIMKKSFDTTLFAWRGHYESSGLLARSPADFAKTPELGLWGVASLSPFSMTNVGVVIRPCLYNGGLASTSGGHLTQAALQCDVKTEEGWMVLLIRLQRVPDATCFINGRARAAWRRVDCNTWDLIAGDDLTGTASQYEDMIVLEDDHSELLGTAVKADDLRRIENAWGRTPRSMVLSLDSNSISRARVFKPSQWKR